MTTNDETLARYMVALEQKDALLAEAHREIERLREVVRKYERTAKCQCGNPTCDRRTGASITVGIPSGIPC